MIKLRKSPRQQSKKTKRWKIRIKQKRKNIIGPEQVQQLHKRNSRKRDRKWKKENHQ